MACQSESNRSPANLASIQFRDYTADLLVFLDAERERLAAEITQAQAEIEASLSFFKPLDGRWSYPAGHVVSH
jgi:multidrug efflux system outer membrane protein